MAPGPPERGGDRAPRGQRPEQARPGCVDARHQHGGRRCPGLLAGCPGPEPCRRDTSAGADSDHVGVVGAADGGDDAAGVVHGVGVAGQGPVPLGGGGVAPADGEALDAPADGVFDEAAAGGQVEEVVLVDRRGDDEERHRPDPFRLRRILDQFVHRVAVHDRPRGDGEVGTDRQDARPGHRGHRPVVAEVVEEVAGPRCQRSPSRRPCPFERGGVADQDVGGGQRLRDEADGEAGPFGGELADTGAVHHPVQGRPPGQVLLGHEPVWLAGEGPVPEAAVGRRVFGVPAGQEAPGVGREPDRLAGDHVGMEGQG